MTKCENRNYYKKLNLNLTCNFKLYKYNIYIKCVCVDFYTIFQILILVIYFII